MKLPEEKLEEIEYYEVYKGETSYEMNGRPVQENRIILHFGEWEKQWKLFGIPIWSKTVEDRTKTFTFKRNRSLETPEKDRGDRMYTFADSEPFKKLHAQLEAYFDNEFAKLYNELHRHEFDYMIGNT